MNYLELTNLAINESGKELDELTSANFGGSFVGQRIYARFKRAVAEAWKAIQIKRNEWEFSTAELTRTLYPRLIVDNITFTSPSTGPDVGVKYKGQESGLEITVINVFQYSDPLSSMEADTSMKVIEFTSPDGGGNRSHLGEEFVETYPNAGDSSFTHIGRGSYKLSEFSDFAREPHWSQFVGYQDNVTAVPMTYIPWDNWVYKEISYTTSTRSAPSYVSQDYNGNLVFYPQTLSPFTINFVCDLAPQELVAYNDTPSLKMLPAELHDWIAYEALERIARFDKDPDLLAYAQAQGQPYRRKAERSLLPLVTFAESQYNKYSR